MKTLVLNIDRDDDFGRKAKIKSPILGIKNNINAANQLGQVDPEDSDVNAIFSAISTYNSLVKDKKNVEIATICGHINVGFKSDEILANHLEQVIKETKADNVILVSDGLEDEYIIPIIQSRIKITSINRVSVKQSRELEDTYYRILKILDDEKVQKQFILPIALVLIVWAFFTLIGMAASGFGAILLTLGVYLLIRVFRWEKNIAIMWNEIKSGFLTGKLSIYTYILTILILIVFGFFAYTNTNFKSDIAIIPFLSFMKNMVWGIVIAGIVAMFGRVVDIYVKDKKAPWNYWIVPFSLLSFGFISYAVTRAFDNALRDWPNNFYEGPFLTLDFFFYTITGILIALMGIVSYHYIKEIHMNQSKEPEIEKQKTKLLDES